MRISCASNHPKCCNCGHQPVMFIGKWNSNRMDIHPGSVFASQNTQDLRYPQQQHNFFIVCPNLNLCIPKFTEFVCVGWMDSETDVVLPKALPISLPIVSLNFVQKLARKPKSQRASHFGPPTPQIVAIAQRTPAVPDPQTLPGPLRPPLFSAVPSAFFTLYLTFVAAVPYNPPMVKLWVNSSFLISQTLEKGWQTMSSASLSIAKFKQMHHVLGTLNPKHLKLVMLSQCRWYILILQGVLSFQC